MDRLPGRKITMKKPSNRKRALIGTTIAALSTISLIVPPKHAQAGFIPTFDLANIMEAMTTTSQMSAQVGQISNTVQQVTKVLGVQKLISGALGGSGSGLRFLGGNSIGSVLSSAEMGLQSISATQQTAEMMVSEIKSIGNNPFSMNNILNNIQIIYSQSQSLPGFGSNNSLTQASQNIANAFNGSQTASQAQQTLQQNLYAQSPSPSSYDRAQVSTLRQTVAQNASTGGMLASTATLQSLGNTNKKTTATLATAITSSTTVRGDIQANSAIQMKILEQVMLENQMLSWLVRVESAQSITSQPVYVGTTGQ